MRREYELHVVVEPGVLRALTAALALLLPLELGSETVQLTTSYPAPSGVYNQIITTGPGDNLLARSGGRVGIRTGATALTGARLQVGAAAYLALAAEFNGDLIINGNEAIRSNPTTVMTLNPDTKFASGVSLTGLHFHAAGSPGTGGVTLGALASDPGERNLQASGPGLFGGYTTNVVGGVTFDLATGGKLHADSMIAARPAGSCATAIGHGAVCGVGQYATRTPGIRPDTLYMSDFMSSLLIYTPKFFCCSR